MSDDGYRKLDVYRMVHELAARIHKMTLTLPALERYEEAAQVRRSSKRVSASIVEGCAQRKFKARFLVCLHRGLGSADETRGVERKHHAPPLLSPRPVGPGDEPDLDPTSDIGHPTSED
jgi:hypothetical protein